MPPKTFYEVKPDAYIFKAKRNEDDNEEGWVSKPEEKVRQWVLYELISTYGYSINNIIIEKQVKVGTRNHFADIVVLQDNSPFIVIECKRQKNKKTEAGMDQAVSYASANSIHAQFAVFTNGHGWQVKRKIHNSWINVPDIPKKLNDTVLDDFGPFVKGLKEVLPLLHWKDKSVPEKNSRCFLYALQHLFIGSLIFNSVDKDLRTGIDNLLRVLISAKGDDYCHGKLAHACKAFNAYFRKIKFKNLMDETFFSHSTLRELALKLPYRFEDIAKQSNMIETAETQAIRLIITLLQYLQAIIRLEKIIKHPEIPINITKELIELLRIQLATTFGMSFPDILTNEEDNDLLTVYETEWEYFKKNMISC